MTPNLESKSKAPKTAAKPRPPQAVKKAKKKNFQRNTPTACKASCGLCYAKLRFESPNPELGKGRVMPPPKPSAQVDCLPLPLHPSPKDTGQGAEPPSKPPAWSRWFSTPSHCRTAQRGGYASGISAAGVASVAEAMIADMRHGLGSLPAMNRSGLFNPPVQGSVPATPEAPMTKGVPALWTPDQPCAGLDASTLAL